MYLYIHIYIYIYVPRICVCVITFCLCTQLYSYVSITCFFVYAYFDSRSAPRSLGRGRLSECAADGTEAAAKDTGCFKVPFRVLLGAYSRSFKSLTASSRVLIGALLTSDSV